MGDPKMDISHVKFMDGVYSIHHVLITTFLHPITPSMLKPLFVCLFYFKPFRISIKRFFFFFQLHLFKHKTQTTASLLLSGKLFLHMWRFLWLRAKNFEAFIFKVDFLKRGSGKAFQTC